MTVQTPEVITVSVLTNQIKRYLEEQFPFVFVIGEVSNLKFQQSGHIYFTLKDEQSQINCAIWRSRVSELTANPENGKKYIVSGSLSVYEKSGSYMISIVNLQPLGIGELQLAFEKMKQKLQGEGLFDAAYKKKLPVYPQRIGVVTSPTGAALRDIIQILRRRAPSVEIILRPAKVQGEGSAEDIACGIRDLNDWGQVDLLIVGRGGGSLEDLWAFNEEVVARAIFSSRIPVISAVGHETDFTIADFVADLRAPTPSAAAEIAVKDFLELRKNLLKDRDRLIRSLIQHFKFPRDQFRHLKRRINLRSPMDMVHQHNQTVDDLIHRLRVQIRRSLDRQKQQLDMLTRHFQSLDPYEILRRGYSITRLKENQHVITSADDVTNKSVIETILYKGKLESQVTDITFPGNEVSAKSEHD